VTCLDGLEFSRANSPGTICCWFILGGEKARKSAKETAEGEPIAVNAQRKGEKTQVWLSSKIKKVRIT
jgi:hypothetical protein